MTLFPVDATPEQRKQLLHDALTYGTWVWDAGKKERIDPMAFYYDTESIAAEEAKT